MEMESSKVNWNDKTPVAPWGALVGNPALGTLGHLWPAGGADDM